MKILETQRSLLSLVEKGEGCKDQHFHVIVCLDPGEVGAFTQLLRETAMDLTALRTIVTGDKPMKILCVCHAGAVRSVAMADMLRQLFKKDAMPVSWDKASDETWNMMCNWADRIFIVEEYQRARVKPEHASKVTLIPLGVDRWFNAHHPELRAILPKMLDEALK